MGKGSELQNKISSKNKIDVFKDTIIQRLIERWYISHMETFNIILEYPEFVMNIHFVSIATMPL